MKSFTQIIVLLLLAFSFSSIFSEIQTAYANTKVEEKFIQLANTDKPNVEKDEEEEEDDDDC